MAKYHEKYKKPKWKRKKNVQKFMLIFFIVTILQESQVKVVYSWNKQGYVLRQASKVSGVQCVTMQAAGKILTICKNQQYVSIYINAE